MCASSFVSKMLFDNKPPASIDTAIRIFIVISSSTAAYAPKQHVREPYLLVFLVTIIWHSKNPHRST